MWRERIAPWLVLLCLSGLAMMTWWFAQGLQNSQETGQRSLPSDKPDFIIDELTLTRFDSAGQAAYTLQAAELRHFPANDSAWLRQPFLQRRNLLDSDAQEAPRPRQEMSAEEAWLTVDPATQFQQIELTRQVVLRQAAQGDSPELKLTSNALTVLPDYDVIQTDAVVTLQRGSMVLQGEGMKLDNTTKTLELYHKVHATYVPIRPALKNS